ncbi:MAG: sensor histidine kinase [Spirochaetales bacterium]|nr:sensor histidine kinase [Spirochaetales bacterium]
MDEGSVSISLEKEGKGINLLVRDNGIGIDEKILVNQSHGFGITIIKMIVDQLNGTFTIQKNNGTRNIVYFEI